MKFHPRRASGRSIQVDGSSTVARIELSIMVVTGVDLSVALLSKRGRSSE